MCNKIQVMVCVIPYDISHAGVCNKMQVMVCVMCFFFRGRQMEVFTPLTMASFPLEML